MTITFRRKMLCLLLALFAHRGAAAAEVVLRPRCESTGAIIRLGDLAEIRDANPAVVAQLQQLELLPAPAAGKSRVLSARQLKELLALTEADVSQLRLMGANAIEIRGVAASGTSFRAEGGGLKSASLPRAVREKAVEQVEEAISAYLAATVAGSAWDVQLDTSSIDVALLAEHTQWRVVGGQQPWVGQQTFVISASSGQSHAQHLVKAQVAQRAMVVVTVRPLERGHRISRQDVELKPLDKQNERNSFARVEDVIGQETLRPLSAGMVLDRRSVRSPLLVHARQPVEVVAHCGGLRVRTMGRVLENGSLGDLVTVESDFDTGTRRGRSKADVFTARVSGPQQVEVLVQGATIPATPLPPPTAAGRHALAR